jgi:hypothetical protein
MNVESIVADDTKSIDVFAAAMPLLANAPGSPVSEESALFGTEPAWTNRMEAAR